MGPKNYLLVAMASVLLPISACAQEVSTQKSPTAEAPSAETSSADQPSNDASIKLASYEEPADRSSKATPSKTTSVPQTGPVPIACKGMAQQGGLVVCKTEPGAKVKIARGEDDFYFESADGNGLLFVGFDRDDTKGFVEYAGDRVSFDLAKRDYDISRIDDLPSNMVSEYSEAELKRIRAATARKKIGFASRAATIGFEDGFIYPIQEKYIKTTNFGAQRILNGVPKRPHYGVDLAAPKGTPIVAPADGIVSMADEDMYFEGALLLIDHGQGLISYYLHMDDIVVEKGQRVKQGEQIATVGSKGRSTGPHLCWRLKWRNRNLDPELLTQWTSES